MANSASGRLERIRAAIDEYQGRLIAYAARITGDLDSARDIVQDTFLRLCEQDLDDLADRLPAWLFRVCRNRALDVRKKEGPLRPLDQNDDPPAASATADPHRLLEGNDRTRLVLAALAELPVAQQEVLRLRLQEELSYKQISAITRHSVSNVGVLIHTGLRRIRQRLREADAPRPVGSEGGRTHA
jgi:RNA polymerase sigma-70 factor (ECF subfamily)